MLPIESFDTFAREAEPRLRQALSASLGSERGRDATADALAYGWEHWSRVAGMDNPFGYLFVVGRERGRRPDRRPPPVELLAVEQGRTPWIEPGLPDALSQLSEQQRLVVMLLHCFQWTMSEVAELMDVKKSTVQSYAERGMDGLRNRMGVAT
ncbi:MAG: sigma-70 family RNA polymerase sigma factor [Acidimicrobiales bacterium]